MRKLTFSKNFILKSILITLGILFIFAIVYSVLQIFKGDGINFDSQNLNLSSNKKVEIDQETGWKIYQNDKYGFDLIYPKEFSVVDWAYKTGNFDLLIYIGENSDIGDGPVSIGIEKGIRGFDEYLQKRNYYPEYIQKFEDVEIGFDNYKAKRFSENTNYNSEKYTGELDYVDYFVEHFDHLFIIHYDRKQKSQISEEEFDQILSSIRFR